VSLKIIHCADLHLDSVFAELSPSASKMRREDLRSAFSKIISLVQQKNADILIISGDMFDSSDVLHQTVKFVKEKIAEIKDIPVYICAGNHDPKKANSCYETENFGKNVHIFGSSIEKIETQNYDIYGVSFSEPTVDGSFLDGFLADNPDKINIMVMHGDFVSEGQSSKFNPVTKSNISYSGMDYVALGHIHKPSSIHNAGRTFFAYCGCPESQGFEETGLKGVYTGTVSRGRCNLSFRPVQYRICATLQCDITGMKNHDEIIAEVHKKLKSAYGENYMTNIYRVTFTGTLQTDEPTDFVQLEKKLSEDIYFVQVRNYTRPDINLEELSSEMNLKGIFVKKMLERINSTVDKVERNNLEKAMYLGLSAFEGEVNHYEN